MRVHSNEKTAGESEDNDEIIDMKEAVAQRVTSNQLKAKRILAKKETNTHDPLNFQVGQVDLVNNIQRLV